MPRAEQDASCCPRPARTRRWSACPARAPCRRFRGCAAWWSGLLGQVLHEAAVDLQQRRRRSGVSSWNELRPTPNCSSPTRQPNCATAGLELLRRAQVGEHLRLPATAAPAGSPSAPCCGQLFARCSCSRLSSCSEAWVILTSIVVCLPARMRSPMHRDRAADDPAVDLPQQAVFLGDLQEGQRRHQFAVLAAAGAGSASYISLGSPCRLISGW